MAVDQRVNAGKIWPVLVELASAKRTLTYGELGPKLGILHRNLNLPLDVIAQYCKRVNWPPLTVVIVNADKKPVEGADDPTVAFARVTEFDWAKVKNPFELFSSTK